MDSNTKILLKSHNTNINKLQTANSNNDSNIKSKKSKEEERIKCEAMIMNLLKSKLNDYINNLSNKIPILRNFDEISYKFKYIKDNNQCLGENKSRAFGREPLRTIELAKWFYNKDYNGFTFTKPLIEWDDQQETRHYKNKLKEGDKVFIFARLDRLNEPDHLTILIINHYSEVYTIGFGYIDERPIEPSPIPFIKNLEKKTSAILLPDYIFEIQMFRQACNDSLNKTNKYLKLLASTVLTTEFKNKLFTMLDNIKYKDINKTDYFLFEWQSNNNNIKSFNEEVLKKIQGKFIDPYNELKDKLETSLFVVNKHYYMNIPDIQYCRISPKWRAPKYQNCASFIDNIFDNILDCSFKGLPVQWFSVEPKYCKQSSKSIPIKCRDDIKKSLKYWDALEKIKNKSVLKIKSKSASSKIGYWDRITGKTNKERLAECENIILEDIDIDNSFVELNEKEKIIFNKYYKEVHNNINFVSLNYTFSNFVKYPISNKNLLFNYTQPIVDIDKDNKIIKNYQKIKLNDTIQIWITYDMKGEMNHTVCQISGIDYNFSFGFYYDDTKTKLRLNTPDSNFHYCIIRQNQFPKEKNLKLIAKSKITKNNIDVINNFFNTINIVQPDFYLIKIYKNKIFDSSKIQEYSDLLNYIKLYNINEFEKINDNEYMYVISQINKSNIADNDYCYYSGKKTKRQNCTSKILQLFDDIINCGGIIENLIVIPALCYQRKDVKVPKCSKTSKNIFSKKSKESNKTKKNITKKKGFFGRIINRFTTIPNIKPIAKSTKQIPRSPNATTTPSISNSNSSSTLVVNTPIVTPTVTPTVTPNKPKSVKKPWYNKLKFWKRTKKNM